MSALAKRSCSPVQTLSAAKRLCFGDKELVKAEVVVVEGRVSVKLVCTPGTPASEPELEGLEVKPEAAEDLTADEEMPESPFVQCMQMHEEDGVMVQCTLPTNGSSQLCHSCKHALRWWW